MTEEEMIVCMTEKLKFHEDQLNELKERLNVDYEISWGLNKPAMSISYLLMLMPQNKIPDEIKQFYQSVFNSCISSGA